VKGVSGGADGKAPPARELGNLLFITEMKQAGRILERKRANSKA
jgi:hypothetical protein